MLQTGQAVHDLIVKRAADKVAEEKRQLAEAEAMLKTYLALPEEHPEMVEELADAATLFGWSGPRVTFECQLTADLPKMFEQLDALEYVYRAAYEKVKAQRELLLRQGFRQDENGEFSQEAEKFGKPSLGYLLYVLYQAAVPYEAAWDRMDRTHKGAWIRRSIPARYLLHPKNLVESSHPPAELPIAYQNLPEPLLLPPRPDMYDVYEKVNEATNEAQTKVYREAIQGWEAERDKRVAEHDAKLAKHAAWVKEETARRTQMKDESPDQGAKESSRKLINNPK